MEGTNKRRVRVLLIEDDPGDAVLIQNLVDKEFMDIIHVSDGEEALCYLYRKKPYHEAAHPHFILLDLNLPKEHGFKFLETVKQDKQLHVIPIIILTTVQSEDIIMKAYEMGANFYITKPTDLNEFKHIIDTAQTCLTSVVRLPSFQQPYNESQIIDINAAKGALNNKTTP